MAQAQPTLVAADSKTPRLKVAKREIDVAAGTLKFNFSNGTVLTVAVDKLPPAIQRQGLLVGIEDKVGDAYASVAREAAELGQDPVEAAVTIAKQEIAKLVAGIWRAKRAGGGASVRFLDLVDPLMSVLPKQTKDGKPRTRESVIADLHELTQSELSAIRSRADVIAAMAELAKSQPKPATKLDSQFS